MADILNKETNTINLGELSKYNGKSGLENFKVIMELLVQKAEFYDIPQKVVVSFPKGVGDGC